MAFQNFTRANWKSYWEERRRAAAAEPELRLDPRVLARHSVAADTVIGGGISVGQILSGKIAEHQIPLDVRQAFHAQYPNLHHGLVAEVLHLRGHEAAISGLVNGIKGKLFEQDYVNALNAGHHLPSGFHAVLAHSANQPGWDIQILGPHGHTQALLQAKATSSAELIRHAVHLHPHIGVVATSGVASHLHAVQPGLHVINSGISNAALSHHVADAIGQAGHAAAFHLPVIGYLAAAGFQLYAYHHGKQSAQEALARTGVGLASVTASACVVHLLPLAAHPILALIAGVATAYAVSRLGQELVVSQIRLQEVLARADARTRTAVAKLRDFKPGSAYGSLLLPAASC